MPEWIKQNLPVVIMFTVGTYISLSTLEIKFNYQELRAEERYRVLIGIQKSVNEHTKQLAELKSEYAGVDQRLTIIETYIPKDLVDIEKDVINMKKDISMINYRLDKDNKGT